MEDSQRLSCIYVRTRYYKEKTSKWHVAGIWGWQRQGVWGQWHSR